MEELVLNSPVMMCCGVPRTECRCNHSPEPMANDGPRAVTGDEPEANTALDYLFATDRGDAVEARPLDSWPGRQLTDLPTDNPLTANERAPMSSADYDTGDEPKRRESPRKVGANVLTLNEAGLDAVLFGSNWAG